MAVHAVLAPVGALPEPAVLVILDGIQEVFANLKEECKLPVFAIIPKVHHFCKVND